MGDKSKTLWHSGVSTYDSEIPTPDKEKALAIRKTYEDTKAKAKQKEIEVREKAKAASPESRFFRIPMDSPVTRALNQVTK